MLFLNEILEQFLSMKHCTDLVLMSILTFVILILCYFFLMKSWHKLLKWKHFVLLCFQFFCWQFPFKKFLGHCNDLDTAMNKCLKEEVSHVWEGCISIFNGNFTYPSSNMIFYGGNVLVHVMHTNYGIEQLSSIKLLRRNSITISNLFECLFQD